MMKSKALSDTRSEGFTLLEVLVVAAIIGILAAIAVPTVSGSRRAAYEARCVKSLRSLTDAEEMHYRDNFDYTASWTSLDDYLPAAYSGWARKAFFIENYSLSFQTSFQNQHYTVFAWPLDRSLRLNTFGITDDAIPLYHHVGGADDMEPVR
jgi:prepilin-type N-terminal cleavage/methylation domain-containing protein